MCTSLAQSVLPSTPVTPLTPLLCPPAPPAPLLSCSFSSACMLHGHQLPQGLAFQLLSWQAVCEQVEVPGFILICSLNGFVCSFPLLQTPGRRGCAHCPCGSGKSSAFLLGKALGAPARLRAAAALCSAMLTGTKRFSSLPGSAAGPLSPAGSAARSVLFPSDAPRDPTVALWSRKNPACAPLLGLLQTSP